MFYRFQASFGYSPYLWGAPPRKSSLVATLEKRLLQKPPPPHSRHSSPHFRHIRAIFYSVNIFISYLTVWRYSCNILRRENWENILLRTFILCQEHWAALLLSCLKISWKFAVGKKRSFYSSRVFWAGFGRDLKDLKWGRWGWRWWQRWWRWQYDGDDHDDDDDHDDEDDHDDCVVLTCLAEEQSSQPLPSPHSCPKNLQISFQSRKKTPHIFSWALSECRKMFPRKSGFQNPPHKQLTCSCSCFDPSPLRSLRFPDDCLNVLGLVFLPPQFLHLLAKWPWFPVHRFHSSLFLGHNCLITLPLSFNIHLMSLLSNFYKANCHSTDHWLTCLIHFRPQQCHLFHRSGAVE